MKIEIPGHFTFAFHPATAVLAFPPSRVPAARGFSDVHVTLPHGRGAKRFRPHVTLRGHPSRPDQRINVLDVPFEDFIGVLLALERSLVNAWWSLQRSITIEQLDDEEWVILDVRALTAAGRERLARLFGVRGATVRLQPRLDALADELLDILLDDSEAGAWLNPSELPTMARVHGPLVAARFDDDGELVEGALLSYFERPPIVGFAPGWYIMPLDPIGMRVVYRLAFENDARWLIDAVDRARSALGWS